MLCSPAVTKWAGRDGGASFGRQQECAMTTEASGGGSLCMLTTRISYILVVVSRLPVTLVTGPESYRFARVKMHHPSKDAEQAEANQVGRGRAELLEPRTGTR